MNILLNIITDNEANNDDACQNKRQWVKEPNRSALPNLGGKRKEASGVKRTDQAESSGLHKRFKSTHRKKIDYVSSEEDSASVFSKDVYPLPEKKFQKKIFQLLADISDKIDEMSNPTKSCTLPKILPSKVKQLTSAAELFEYDEKLMEDDNLGESFKLSIKRIGGPSPEHHVTNILKR